MAEIAKANNFNVTGAELTKFAAEQTVELSDEDLEAVAGGGGLAGGFQGDGDGGQWAPSDRPGPRVM